MAVILLLGVACQQQTPATDSALQLPQQIETLAWQGNDQLWIGSTSGVVRLDMTQKSVQSFEAVDSCRAILVISPEVWCAGEQAYRYAGQSWQAFDIKAHRFLETRDGQLWAGTDGGLFVFSEAEQMWERVVRAARLSPRFGDRYRPGVHLAFEDRQDHLWFHSYSEPYVGVTRRGEEGHQTWQPAGKSNVIAPKVEAADGTIWGISGTIDSGLLATWDGETWRMVRPLSVPYIDLIEDQNGAIWALSTSDVARRDEAGWAAWQFEALRSARSIQQTNDGAIWIVTASDGLLRWQGEDWRHYTGEDGLPADPLTVLLEGDDGSLLLGTQGSGLYNFQREEDRWMPLKL